jgi:L-ribulose-5-phosphate 4-epimerase
MSFSSSVQDIMVQELDGRSLERLVWRALVNVFEHTPTTPKAVGDTMLDTLKAEVLDANLELVRQRLVLYTWGNASGIDRRQGLVVIKPSGVKYDHMSVDDMVVTDLDGNVVEGALKPSSDLPTHLLLYHGFPSIGGIVHTHSEYATIWAQAGRAIPPYGTTHADYFHGPVPVTAPLTDEDIAGDYVHNTGLAILRRFQGAHGSIDPDAVPAVLVDGHAPFTWGSDAAHAAHHATVLESVARMALHTEALDPNIQPVSQALLDRHYYRKHGPLATYGQ